MAGTFRTEDEFSAIWSTLSYILVLTENPERFDWTWVAAHMKRLPPGKLGPRGCIKLVVNMPEELDTLPLPEEIKVVDAKMHEEGSQGSGRRRR
jgi:hypothetical protein